MIYIHFYAYCQTEPEALDAAREKTMRTLGRAPRILVMPHGGSTLPLMRL
jgi:hypothetical protein